MQTWTIIITRYNAHEPIFVMSSELDAKAYAIMDARPTLVVQKRFLVIFIRARRYCCNDTKRATKERIAIDAGNAM
jgi:hypothetical protein